MQASTEELKDQTQHQLEKIFEALESGGFQPIRRMLNGLRPVEIARLLESTPPKSRVILWQLVDKELDGEVLQELSEDVRGYFLRRMDHTELAAATQDLDDDDVTDILQQLPDRVIREVLAAMNEQNRQRVESLLSYGGDTAGGLMSSNVITIRPRLTLDVVLRYLRRHEELPASMDNLIVVNRNDQFLGLLPISKILTSDPNITVREIMVTDVDPIRAEMSDSEVARLFEDHDWISAPVVDDQGKVLGRITIDDVVDVIREDAEHSFMSMAGLDAESGTFAPVMKTAPRRIVWLLLNLLTASLAASVIHQFEDTISKVVTLAVLMPIAASMGGVAGSQTLTVVIRGIALGQVGRSNAGWLLSREFMVAALNGLALAIVLGLAVSWVFDDYALAVIIGAAMLINLITAATAGTLIPLLLRTLGIDPAMASGMMVMTVTDVVGFFAFLGLAAYFYA